MGSERNVFSRFFKIAKMYKPNYVVRICADNPFIDPKEIDKLVTYTVKIILTIVLIISLIKRICI